MKRNHHYNPQLPSPWLLRALSVFSFLLSVPACFVTVHFFRRGLPGDTYGAGAAGVIGAILMGASIAAAIRARTVVRQHGCAPASVTRRCAWVIPSVAAPLGLMCIGGSVLILWDVAALINQEYLHWFRVRSQRSFGDTPTSAMLWGEFLPLGVFLAAVGAFLLWFVIQAIFSIGGEISAKEVLRRSEDNPYSPPEP